MDIENKIQNLITNENTPIDADNFLDKLHNTREQKLRNRQRWAFGVSTLIVVLLVGALSINQLQKSNYKVNSAEYLSETEMSEEMLNEYYEELMVYLVNESDDIWSTIEFLYEIENNTEN